MASKPETVKLFDEIAPALDEVDKAQTKIAPRLKELESKVRADAKLDEPKLGEVHVAALGKLIKDIDTAKQLVKTPEYMIARVLKDEDFVDEKLKEIEAIKQRQENAAELLSSQYKLAKELENLAEESKAKDRGDADELFDTISQAELMAKDLKKTVEETEDQVSTIQGRAFAAKMARDAKGLADAQKQAAAVGLKELKERTDGMNRFVEGMKSMAADTKDKDPKALAQLKDSLDDLTKLLAKCAQTMQVTEAFQQNVKGLKIEPIDVNKALKVLKLPSSAKDKLAKVLKGPAADFEKGLNELAKALKLKDTTGEDMLRALEKADVM
jgi:hypothetical protein